MPGKRAPTFESPTDAPPDDLGPEPANALQAMLHVPSEAKPAHQIDPGENEKHPADGQEKDGNDQHQ